MFMLISSIPGVLELFANNTCVWCPYLNVCPRLPREMNAYVPLYPPHFRFQKNVTDECGISHRLCQSCVELLLRFHRFEVHSLDHITNMQPCGLQRTFWGKSGHFKSSVFGTSENNP